MQLAPKDPPWIQDKLPRIHHSCGNKYFETSWSRSSDGKAVRSIPCDAKGGLWSETKCWCNVCQTWGRASSAAPAEKVRHLKWHETNPRL